MIRPRGGPPEDTFFSDLLRFPGTPDVGWRKVFYYRYAPMFKRYARWLPDGLALWARSAASTPNMDAYWSSVLYAESLSLLESPHWGTRADPPP